MKIPVDVNDLTDWQCRDILMKILEKLEDEENGDLFGTEGWRSFFGFEE